MADFLGFGVKAKRDLFIRTEIHIFGDFFLKIIQLNKSITFKMSLSCTLKILYLVSQKFISKKIERELILCLVVG